MRHANSLSRLLGALALAGLCSYPLPAQGVTPSLSSADSALVGRILLAEDRRDTLDAALVEGRRHADPRVRVLATRAYERSRDAAFSRRDSLEAAALPAPPTWPEPAWKARYRSLTERRDDCRALRAAVRDDEVAVRIRAAQLARASCATDDVLVGDLMQWIDRVPSNTDRHEAAAASWQLAAHGLVALARLQPDSAEGRVRVLAGHRQWQLRQYAARAAAQLKDRETLRRLMADADDNVAEAAIEGLAPIAQPADAERFRSALSREGAQAVRVAAGALKSDGSESSRVAAQRALERFNARANASERDVRVALLALLGRPASEDAVPARPDDLPRDAVALALGAERHLQVAIDDLHGGGSFVLRLRGDVAPLMASRILAIAESGFYDGTTWHRVEHDFVIQGGSPGANEYVGHPRALIDELGTVPHARGTVGMSTRGHDTGDAQWFINLRDNLRLGRDYTVWAEVVEGMDVVDRVLEGDRIASIRVERR